MTSCHEETTSFSSFKAAAESFLADKPPVVIHYFFLRRWMKQRGEQTHGLITIEVLICPGKETNETNDLLTEVGKLN